MTCRQEVSLLLEGWTDTEKQFAFPGPEQMDPCARFATIGQDSEDVHLTRTHQPNPAVVIQRKTHFAFGLNPDAFLFKSVDHLISFIWSRSVDLFPFNTSPLHAVNCSFHCEAMSLA
jgi:hypothetical protein